MGNTDDGYTLRHNPLGIHALDGADIVVGKSPRHKAGVPSTDELLAEPMQAKTFYEASIDSVPTTELDDAQVNGLEDLSISSGLQKPLSAGLGYGADLGAGSGAGSSSAPRSGAGAAKSDGIDVDFGSEFIKDLSKDLGLGRQLTITSRPMPPSASTPNIANLKTTSGPSQNPLLIQRLKSIRRQAPRSEISPAQDYEDDVRRAEGLPDDVLRMIAFSPDSPWIENELWENDVVPEPEPVSAPMSKASSTEPADFASTPMELNPFHSAKMKQDMLLQMSPSVSTLSAFSDPDPSPAPAPAPVPRAPTIEETDPVSEDDRGRLFLQINKIANMRGLPIDLTRNPKFTLSLDNGLQTVTTEPMALPATGFNGLVSAKIGQEFELTVAKDLELVLTVGVSMDAAKPPPRPVAPPRRAPKKAPRSPRKANHAPQSSTSSTSSNSPIKSMKNLLMRSPRKKQQRFQPQETPEESSDDSDFDAEQNEIEERIKVQYERDLKEFRRRADVWRGITGERGEYCRGYVIESHYEKDIFGKTQSFAIPMYNEWDKSTKGSPKSVCELQVTMMYVPKLYGSEQIPMSMMECQKKLESAKTERVAGCEGFLTQQGGDCGTMWRRRYFVLKGRDLVGYHEATMKRRAQIHLESAVEVKDKLADDLWCIYEDRSFQITFTDGEAISFYADTIEDRDTWLKALRHSIANSTGQHRSWTDLVFEAREGRS